MVSFIWCSALPLMIAWYVYICMQALYQILHFEVFLKNLEWHMLFLIQFGD